MIGNYFYSQKKLFIPVLVDELIKLLSDTIG